jgi:hypothetical protein
MINNFNKLRVTKKPFFFNKNGIFSYSFFLFLLFSIIHIILLFNIYFSLKYTFLIIIEFLFFLYFGNFNIKIFFRIFIITIIVFLLNILFSEGKIVFSFFFIRITKEGLINGIKKSCLICCTLFFTINILKDKTESFLINFSYKKNSNIILNSLEYFLIFWKEFGANNNIRKLFIRIIRIYKGKEKLERNIEDEKSILTKSFYVYNLVIILSFVLLYFLI